MKNLILFFLVFILASSLVAQKVVVDTTKVKVKNYEIIITEDENGEIQTKINKIEIVEDGEMSKEDLKNEIKKEIEIRIKKDIDGENTGAPSKVVIKKLGLKMKDVAKEMKSLDRENMEEFERDMMELEREMKELEIELEAEVEELRLDMEELEEEITEEIEGKVQTKKRGKYKLYSNWGGIGYGFESLSSRDANNTNDFLREDSGHSINWEFFAISSHLGTPHVAFTTGLGVEWSYKNLNDNIRIMSDDDLTWGELEEDVDLTKNQLRQTLLNVPVMLEFSTSTEKKKNIKISLGYIQRIGIRSRAYYKVNDNGSKNKETERKDFNLARYRGAVTGRLGYRGMTAFVNYDLDQLFDADKGPELYPLTMGVNFRIAPTIRWNTRKRRG